MPRRSVRCNDGPGRAILARDQRWAGLTRIAVWHFALHADQSALRYAAKPTPQPAAGGPATLGHTPRRHASGCTPTRESLTPPSSPLLKPLPRSPAAVGTSWSWVAPHLRPR